MPDPQMHPWAEFRQLVASYLPEPPELLTDEARLRDLGLDSLNSIGLLLAIEDRYEIEFPAQLLSDSTFDTPASLWSVVQQVRGDVRHG